MLNPKQEKFLREYAKSGNAGQAYQIAFGLSNANAARASSSRLLKSPEIQARLAEIQAELASDTICQAKEIQERLTQIARRELSETIFLPNGEQVSKPTSIKDSCRALELLAKINGLFINKSELDLKGISPVVIVDDI